MCKDLCSGIIRKILFLLVFTIFILQFIRCTAVGFGLGAIYDTQNNYKPVQFNELDYIKQGTPVEIRKLDGEIIQGGFYGLEPKDINTYSEIYNDCKHNKADGDYIPALGEITFVIKTGGKEIKFLLVAFDYDGIVLKKKEGIQWFKKPFALFKGAELIDCEKKKFEIERIKDFINRRQIPMLSILVLQTTSGTIKVDLSEVSIISVPAKKNAKIKGLIIGAALDIGVLLAKYAYEKALYGTR